MRFTLFFSALVLIGCSKKKIVPSKEYMSILLDSLNLDESKMDTIYKVKLKPDTDYNDDEWLGCDTLYCLVSLYTPIVPWGVGFYGDTAWIAYHALQKYDTIDGSVYCYVRKYGNITSYIVVNYKSEKVYNFWSNTSGKAGCYNDRFFSNGSVLHEGYEFHKINEITGEIDTQALQSDAFNKLNCDISFKVYECSEYGDKIFKFLRPFNRYNESWYW